MIAGITPSDLPFAAGCFVSIALLGQLVIFNKNKTVLK